MLLPALLAETQYAKHDRIQRKYINRFLDTFHKVERLARSLSDLPRQNGTSFKMSVRRDNKNTQTAPSTQEGDRWEEERKRQAKEEEERKLDISELLNHVFALYHEKGNLQRHLTSFRAQLAVMLDSVESAEAEALPANRNYLHRHGERIKQRLKEIRSDYDDLIKQSSLYVEGANLLLTSLWSLIAQKDNQLNQDLTESTRVIAAESKRDSTALKALAVLTMVFLPGTATATFFALPIFDWRRDRYRPDVAPSIWIYFAVTVPVTATVLYLWRFWFIGEMAKQYTENVRARRAVLGSGNNARIGPKASDLKLLRRFFLVFAKRKNGAESQTGC